MQTFVLEGEFIPMIQLLKAMNWVEHGAMAQHVVTEGLVKYNGVVDYRKRLKVRRGDIVELEDMKVQVL
ncbi:RNA-binding S4 domain-containing protein [Sphingobacterium sp. SGG-5]|uniref:RNA-binding S4 domain-containing protein n=1 Tax=Sphingobacterium sp. SGG-5 TaxID=2710881 RepID=UPI0013EA9A75|nr:RNA-binding S4 domain-containing protein [Sphingobacterium sp. SGG-5]NGM61916.1 RNA-binding S4 domain-containing protein [Sphingobacterium sp. SGG-5]